MKLAHLQYVHLQWYICDQVAGYDNKRLSLKVILELSQCSSRAAVLWHRSDFNMHFAPIVFADPMANFGCCCLALNYLS